MRKFVKKKNRRIKIKIHSNIVNAINLVIIIKT